MFAVQKRTSSEALSDAEGWALKHVSSRKGKWLLRLVVKDQGSWVPFSDRLWGLPLFPYAQKELTVIYTEDEVAKLQRIFTSATLGGFDAKAYGTALANASTDLWRTGSRDDVAMRHVGLHAFGVWFTSDRKLNRGISHAFWSLLGQKEDVPHLTPYEPVHDCEGTVADFIAGLGRWRRLPVTTLEAHLMSTGYPPPTSPAVSRSNAAFDHALQTAVTQASLGLAVEHQPDDSGRLSLESPNVVLGVDMGGTQQQAVGSIVGPVIGAPLVYANTTANIEEAIEERIIKKQIPPTLTELDVAKITKMVRGFTKGQHACLSERRVRDQVEQVIGFEAMKSGKWSEKRFWSSLANLRNRIDPKFRLKGAVKLEPMKDGKPPRLLIADGDDGQLMALIAVWVLEKCVFKFHQDRSIKGASKRAAMKRLIARYRSIAKGMEIVEGDGSAWDTCCQALIRALIEDPLVRHVGVIVAEYFNCEGWNNAHEMQNEEKVLRLMCSDRLFKKVIKIDSIRRSGHRGTSILNWLINFTLWSCAVLKHPEQAHDPLRKNFVSTFGHEIFYVDGFEGDDSMVGAKPSLAPFQSQIEDFWKRAGFNMKLKFVKGKGIAEAVGWHAEADEFGLTGRAAPDLKRCFANNGVSCSNSGKEAARDGDETLRKRLAKATALSRAHEFAGIYPTVSRKFLEFAENIELAAFIDREVLARTGHLDEDITTPNDRALVEAAIYDEIRQANLTVSSEDERKLMEALGVGATEEELDHFRGYIWDVDHLTDFAANRERLPERWR